MLVHSFPPAITANCRVLMLGSMPGKRSLQMHAYYAHPQNLFWPFIIRIFDMPADTPYQDRLHRLHQQHVGIWDVLKECIRASSLDGDIKEHSIIANDFSSLFVQFPNIQHIAFNGNKAEQAFRRHVLRFQSIPLHVQYHKLPSTSPANASIPRDEKFAQWQLLAKISAD